MSSKLFVGGLSWETGDESLHQHFIKYGEILEAVVMKDNNTGRSRGFGFVRYKNPESLTAALEPSQLPHKIDDRVVDAKIAVTKPTIQTKLNPNQSASQIFSPIQDTDTAKLFVGGLPSNLTEEEFKESFESFGEIENTEIIMDKDTGKSRGFGFVSFKDGSILDSVIEKAGPNYMIKNKPVDIKRAMPKISRSRSNTNPNQMNTLNHQQFPPVIVSPDGQHYSYYLPYDGTMPNLVSPYFQVLHFMQPQTSDEKPRPV